MIKRGLSFFLVLALIFALFPASSVFADDGKAYKVGATSLNIRSQPTTQSTVIGSLEDGEVVTVYGERYGWAKIYHNGKVAWVASQFLYPLNSSSQPPNKVMESTGQKVTVGVDSVHIRSGAGIDQPIIGYAYRGDTFQLLEKTNQWAHIRLENGHTAWIAAWLLTTSGSSEQQQTSFNGEPLQGYNIVIDAGHGGFDPGAIGLNGAYEKTFTLDISQTVADQLRQAGATVIMTRTGDYFLTLEERVGISQQYQTHAFISIHLNSYDFIGAQGIRTFYYAGGEDKQLAQAIQQALVQETSLHNGGVRYGNYHVLRENSDLAVLVELGFLTSPYDYSFIQSPEYHAKVADAITKGVINYFKN